MNVLTGSARGERIIGRLRSLGWGRMFVFDRPTPFQGEPWGFDNGAFAYWRRGETFDEDGYRRRLDRAYGIGKPYLAVAPDIVAAGRKSLDYSLAWMDSLPTDWPWYLAVQDKMVFEEVRQVIAPFAGVFLGGTDAFKLMAKDWKDFAHREGKRFHYPRAGTENKLRHALRVGADSLDSAFILWKRSRFEAFAEIWSGNDPKITLFREEDFDLIGEEGESSSL